MKKSQKFMQSIVISLIIHHSLFSVFLVSINCQPCWWKHTQDKVKWRLIQPNHHSIFLVKSTKRVSSTCMTRVVEFHHPISSIILITATTTIVTLNFIFTEFINLRIFALIIFITITTANINFIFTDSTNLISIDHIFFIILVLIFNSCIMKLLHAGNQWFFHDWIEKRTSMWIEEIQTKKI